MRVLHVNTFDTGGGAEQVAQDLVRMGRADGWDSQLLVGMRRGTAQPWVQGLQPAWVKNNKLRRLQHAVRHPAAWPALWRGEENHHHPAVAAQILAREPDILHLHNLHGDYFDLRALANLSLSIPTVITLHDMWLLTGHCAHSFDCTRWQTGCGACPYLKTPPALWRDGTAANWRLRRDTYARSRLAVVTPSRWLMGCVEKSTLAPAIKIARVIPNAVDGQRFAPHDSNAARHKLNLPADRPLLLFMALNPRHNPFKDFATLEAAVRRSTLCQQQGAIVLAVGGGQTREVWGQAELWQQPFTAQPELFYQAADIYVHASRADTFPSAVLEAMSCATPVIASAVGGIPEQLADGGGETVIPHDATALAHALDRLLGLSANERTAIGQRGRVITSQRYTPAAMHQAYRDIYLQHQQR